MRILTGIQPSGKLHIGNYFSVMRKMIEYQEKFDAFTFIANLHALTTFSSKEEQYQNTLDAVCDYLALGVDPEKNTFWLQSDVPIVTELSWYLSMSISVSSLSLAHSYKDKVAKGVSPNAGLYYYPILMAADILAFNTNKVPVGKDQKQHLEYTRDMAVRFNATYGETFIVPEPEIEENSAIIPGIDGQKMSKSYGNTITIFDDEKKIKKAVMSIVTDSAEIDVPKDPDSSVLFAIYSLFLGKEEVQKLKDRFATPGLRYGDVKKELFSAIMDYFSPYRTKRAELAQNKDYIKEVLRKGADKASQAASIQMEKVRRNMGIR
ncbi:MAG: tryptophan--tRNA ligase [Leptospiraceae bacterium]|nr:tryptophan--tRNA ligase [Leptospiraceae bacterium]MCP5496616.1 tryptophan--tRNA ligase [Leptospiraceae bacterium]